MKLIKPLLVAAFVSLAMVPAANAQAVSQATADLVNTLQSCDLTTINQALQDFENLPEAQRQQIIQEISTLDPTIVTQVTAQLQAAGISLGACGLAATGLAFAAIPFGITVLLAAVAAGGGGGGAPDTQ